MWKRNLFLLPALFLLLVACGGPAEEGAATTGAKDVIVEVFRPPT